MLKIGEGKFYITRVISKDKDGKDLISDKGGKYKRLKLMVMDRADKCEDIYDPVFGSGDEKIGQIIKSIGDLELEKEFRAGRLDLNDLVGFSGHCIIGSREHEKYGTSNTIACYLKHRKNAQEALNVLKDFNPVLEEGNDIPF